MRTIYLTKQQEKALLKRYGQHRKVAEALGITYRMWLYLKNHEKELSPRLKMIIDYRLSQ